MDTTPTPKDFDLLALCTDMLLAGWVVSARENQADFAGTCDAGNPVQWWVEKNVNGRNILTLVVEGTNIVVGPKMWTSLHILDRHLNGTAEIHLRDSNLYPPTDRISTPYHEEDLVDILGADKFIQAGTDTGRMSISKPSISEEPKDEDTVDVVGLGERGIVGTETGRFSVNRPNISATPREGWIDTGVTAFTDEQFQDILDRQKEIDPRFDRISTPEPPEEKEDG